MPDSLGDDERRGRVDGGKHVDPLAGAGDEAVAAGLRGGVAANERPAGGGEGPRQIRFHLLLGRPADPIGLLAEVAAGDEDDVGFPPRVGRGLRAGGGGHDAGPKERKTESGEQKNTAVYILLIKELIQEILSKKSITTFQISPTRLTCLNHECQFLRV